MSVLQIIHNQREPAQHSVAAWQIRFGQGSDATGATAGVDTIFQGNWDAPTGWQLVYGMTNANTDCLGIDTDNTYHFWVVSFNLGVVKFYKDLI